MSHTTKMLTVKGGILENIRRPCDRMPGIFAML